MCLISIFPKGTSKSLDKIKGFIQRGMESNRDGSGLMWKINGHKTVNFQKGFKKPEEVYKLLEELDLKDEDEAVFHSRIGTSGLVSDTNCHPFIVTNDKSLIMKTSGRVSYPVMCHNGFFSDYVNHKSDYSDTFHFVYEFAGVPEITALLRRDSKLFEELFSDTHIKRTKLAFLFPERDVLMYGDFVEDDGYFHSHSGYKSYAQNNFFSPTNNGRWSRAKNTVLATDTQYEDSYEEAMSEIYGYSTKQKSIWDDIREETANKIKPLLLQFTHQQMKITDGNYKDFYIVPTVNYKTITNKPLDKGLMFEIEVFNEAVNYMVLVNIDDSELVSVDRELLDNCIIYVKEKNRQRYVGISNLYKQIYQKNCKNPSRSMVKKLTIWLDEKKDYIHGNYKKYGKIWHCDLRNYLSNFELAVEETFVTGIKGTNCSVGAQFTQNETGLMSKKDELAFLNGLKMIKENNIALQQIKEDDSINVNERMD